jgi:hypothetical protein
MMNDSSLDILNSDNISFPKLFELSKQMNKSTITKNLNLKSKIALEFSEDVLSKEKSFILKGDLNNNDNKIKRAALKWILETGAVNDGKSNEYDEVIDKAAIILSVMFKDTSILPIMKEIIFKRNKGKMLIHDLLWGYFSSNEIQTLELIATKLKSDDAEDIKFAFDLLQLQRRFNMSYDMFPQTMYAKFINWYKKNEDYIYFTGESFQEKPNPSYYSINIEAKYLCKKVLRENGTILNITCDQELELVNNLKKADKITKKFISNYSNELHRKDIISWKDWFNCSFRMQLQIALSGGYYDKNFR